MIGFLRLYEEQELELPFGEDYFEYKRRVPDALADMSVWPLRRSVHLGQCLLNRENFLKHASQFS